jgi:aminoglycoside 2'-N-acetyltransferase I
MSDPVTVERMAAWDESSLDERAELSKAVYPPDEAADWPGRHIEWSRPEWGVAVRDEEGRLISYAALQLREATHDGADVVIGGVGGVMTHPDRRGQGYAGVAMQAAADFFAANGADFGLLVCEDRLIPYYRRLGWEVFQGEVVTLQHGEPTVFSFNRVMVKDVAATAPRQGVIDLHGPPW